MASTLSKAAVDRHQRLVLELLKQPGNDFCADCRTRNPRWASWNLGIFICVKCAGIHRKMGTHISKVKSLTLDTWSKEQVERMKSIGNLNANAQWNPNIAKHPPPTDLEESERDSQLERFIRKKYESRAFSSASALTSPTNSTSPTTSLSTAAPPTTNRDSALALGVPTRSSSAIGRRQVRSQAPLHSSTHLGDRSTGQHSSLASSLQYHQPATGSQSFTSPAPPVRPSTAPIPHAIQPHLAPPVPPIPSHMTFSSLSQCTAPYQTNMYTHSSVVSAPSFPVSNTPMAPTSSIRSDGVWGDLLSLVPSTGPSQAHTVASNTGYRPAMQTTPRPADPSFAMASFSQQAPSFAPSNQSLIMLNSMTTPQDQQHNPFNSSMPLEHVDQVPVSSSTGTSNAFNMSNFLPEHMRQQARPTNPFYTSPALSHVSQPSNNPYTNVVMPNQTFQQHPGSFFSQPPTQTMQVPHPGGSYPNHYASVPNFTQPVQSQASPFHPPFY